MRLAVVAPQFPEYVFRYADAMSRRCPVMVAADEGQVASEYEGRDLGMHGVQHVRLMRFKTPLDVMKLIYRLIQFRPTVVHCQEAGGPRRGLFNACVATIFKRSATIALTVHDPLPHSGRDSEYARRSKWPRRYMRWIADVVIVHGTHCAQLYSEDLRGNQKLLISQHGVILEPAEFQALPSYPLKLYFFGRMEAYKGLDTLLAAAQELHEAGLPFELKVEGHGPELDRLAAPLEALPEVTVWRGYVPPRRVMQAIQEAHCVVLPYRDATQSGVLAAAFAGHRCVIASDVGGLRDLVAHDHNGLHVPPGDASALASAIRKLINDETLWRRLQRGAVEAAQRQLNWDTIACGLFQEFGSFSRSHGHQDALHQIVENTVTPENL